MTSNALIVSGVRHRYGDRQALDGVSLEVAHGHRWALLGPNGSGKSTLFKLLATLLPLQEGSVQLCGLDLAKEQAQVRRKLGVVFQSPALDRQLSVAENLRYGGQLYGISGRQLAARIDAVLDATSLADRKGDRVGELSGGLKRRVEIAKALLHQPEVLLLDEPSTGLDPAARKELWDFIGASEGTVLFTTHLMEEAAQADQVTMLHEGQIVAEGSPGELAAGVGDEVLEVECQDADALKGEVARVVHGVPGPRGGAPLDTGRVAVEAGVIRVRDVSVHHLVGPVVDALGHRVERVAVRRPSLEDVFMRATGHGLGTGQAPEEPKKTRRGRRR